jgi:inner membrane protein
VDPVTHGLLGGALAQAGFRQRWGRQATLAMVGGAMLPDIDVFWSHGLWALETHRGITHSFVGAVGLASVLGAAVLPCGREKRWPLLAGLALIALLGGHLFMDLVNNYGIQLFLPFSRARPALDLVFILDPLVTGPMLGALVGGAVWHAQAIRLARGAFAWLALYLAALGLSHGTAVAHLRREAIAQGLTPHAVWALPTPLDPLAWAGFVDDGRYYWRGRVGALGGPVPLRPTLKASSTVAAGLAAQSPDVQLYLWFARFPTLTDRVEGGRRILDYTDLRFASPRLGRRPFGRLRVFLTREGQVERVLFDP